MLRMCVCAFSLRRESPDWSCSIGARLGSNTHSKHLKITTTLSVRTLSPYKDYSSLFRWQANLCVPLCNYGIASMNVCCDFGVLALFCCLWSYLVVCGFSRDIRDMDAFCVVYEVWCLCLACGTSSGYESAGPLGAWLGTQVLVL
jgi:hypothetical protein